jgi:hypothetical protein
LSRGYINVCIKESADGGIIIPALEIIEARLSVVVVAMNLGANTILTV